MGKANNPHRKIRCVETGEVFNTMQEAGDAVDRGVSAISRAISEGTKCAGYHWEKIDEKEFAIYKLTLPNGKSYIGQTSSLVSARWGGGCGYAHSHSSLYDDIMAFGWNNVQREILERVDTKEEALQQERKYILEYETNNPERGYNIQTNVFACGTYEEIRSHRRRYRRQYANTQNPHKTVICVETGIEYDSALEAGRQLGLNSSHISAICRGDKNRHTCGGFHWTFGQVKD